MVVLENDGKCLWQIFGLGIWNVGCRPRSEESFRPYKTGFGHDKEFQTRTCKRYAGCTRINLEMLAVAVLFSTSHVVWNKDMFEALCCSILGWNTPGGIGNNFWNHMVYTSVFPGWQISVLQTIICSARSRGRNRRTCWNILGTLMVAVIRWPCYGARRKTSISAAPFSDIWTVVALSNCNTNSKLAVIFSQTKICFHKRTHCLAFAFDIVWCRHLVWFGYPCLWPNLNIFRWTNYNVKCFNWLSVGYGLTVKIGPIPCPGWTGKSFCNFHPWMQTMVFSDIRRAVLHRNQDNKFPLFLSVAATSEWNPTSDWQQNFSHEPKRRKGRPSKRWDDNLQKIAIHYFRASWATAAQVGPELPFLEHVYVQFFSNMWPMNRSRIRVASRQLGKANERTWNVTPSTACIGPLPHFFLPRTRVMSHVFCQPFATAQSSRKEIQCKMTTIRIVLARASAIWYIPAGPIRRGNKWTRKKMVLKWKGVIFIGLANEFPAGRLKRN